MNEEIANNMRAHWEREVKAIPGVRWWKLGEPEWEGLTMAGVAQVEALGRFVPDEFKKLVQ